MDDNEDLVLTQDGTVDAKYRAWTEIDPQVYSLNDPSTPLTTMRVLDVSYNCLHNLPKEIQQLTHLHELNCSCNRITSLPTSLGTLIYLKTFKANGNQLSTLPNEIGQCRNLQSLILSENKLSDIPHAMAKCTRLHTIQLQNNELRQLPVSIGKLYGKIQDMNVLNNPDLQMIPKETRGDSDVVLWILYTHWNQFQKLETIHNAIKDVSELLQYNQDDIDRSKTKILDLKSEKHKLLLERHSVEYYLCAKRKTNECREWTKRTCRFLKRLISKKTPIYIKE